MSQHFETMVIAVVFASQIAVLSFFTPYRRRKIHALMTMSYPPSEYPRLYPVAKERMNRMLAFFKPVHFAIGVGSIVTLFAGLAFAESPEQFGRWMFYCLTLQVLPMYVSLPWAIKVQRAFRAMPPPSVRSAELRQWRVNDFVSPFWITLGLVGQALALTCTAVAYIHQPDTLRLVIFSSLVSVLLLLRMSYVLLGPAPLMRPDPYMAPADTFRLRQRRFKMLFRGGAVMGAYIALMLLYSAQLLHFDFGFIWAGVSIVFQLLGLALVSAQGRDLNTRDFTVYRPDASVAP